MKGKGLVATLLGSTTLVIGASILSNSPSLVERAQSNNSATESVLQSIRQNRQEQPQSYTETQQTEVPVVQYPAKAERKVSYKTIDFSEDTDQVLLARMIFGEARSCTDKEKIAIGYTALNRANDNKRFNGTDIRSAVLCPKQYSCFNSNDTNLVKLKDPEKYDAKSWAKSLEIAEGILSGKYSDEMHATHYHALSSHPKWQDSPEMTKLGIIDKHLFYKEN